MVYNVRNKDNDTLIDVEIFEIEDGIECHVYIPIREFYKEIFYEDNLKNVKLIERFISIDENLREDVFSFYYKNERDVDKTYKYIKKTLLNFCSEFDYFISED